MKYRVVIIGAGKIGAFFDTPDCENILTHAHAFTNNDNFELIGFYDSDFEKAKKAAVLWNCRAFSRFEEAMESIDVVCCTVPDKYHFEVLLEIAKYPVKFVFAEKPLACSIEEVEMIVKKYIEKNIFMNVNYSRRFLSEITKVRESIENAGRFLYGSAYYCKGILHSGSHMIDLIINLLGDIQSYEYIDCVDDFYEDDKSVEAKLNVASGTIYLLPIDFRSVSIFELDLLFEKKRIRIINSGFNIEIFNVMPSRVFEGYFNYANIENIEVNYDNTFVNAVNNIYDVLEYGKNEISSMCNAEKVTRVCCYLKDKGN